MPNDLERVRYVLEAAIKRLTEESGAGESASDSLLAPRLTSSQGADCGPPVILVVLDDLKTGSQNENSQPPPNAGETETPAGSDSGTCETKLSHPGLERFTIFQSDAHPTAPKACFMEPARKCVNSRACEMRGF